MEGTLILNFVLLALISAALGFWLGYVARTLSHAPRQRADEEDVALMRRALAGDMGGQA